MMDAAKLSFEKRLLVVLLGLTAFFTLWIIPASVEDPEGFGFAEGLAPSFSVYLVASLMALTLVARLIRVIRMTPEVPAAPKQSSGAEDDDNAGGQKRVSLIIGACLVFPFLLIPWVGFYTSSFAFVAFLAVIMGERRYSVLILLPLLLITGIYAGFELGFTIFLPRGELFLQLFEILGD